MKVKVTYWKTIGKRRVVSFEEIHFVNRIHRYQISNGEWYIEVTDVATNYIYREADILDFTSGL